MDDNLGEIMDAVMAREAATGEDWTIIVVTDHGHQPQQGFGHGFQSPDETETFVIADGPNFRDGYINLQYEIVDTTPTVVSLFGGTPRPGSDGVSLTTLSVSDVNPADLEAGARGRDRHEQPNPTSSPTSALSLRTIFATVPYYVYGFRTDFSAGLPGFLAGPVVLIFDGLYVATNVPAQIVALSDGRDRRQHLPGVATAAAHGLAATAGPPAGRQHPRGGKRCVTRGDQPVVAVSKSMAIAPVAMRIP